MRLVLCAREPQGTARDGVCVRTGTAGSSLSLTLVWIVFTEVSSSRSGSGLAAGIWCSGIILTTSRGLMARRDRVKRSATESVQEARCRKRTRTTFSTLPLLLRGTNDRTESKLCVDNTRRTIESYINHEVNVRMLACSA